MIASVIEQAGDQLGQFLPRLAGALVLLILGLLAAILIGRLTRRALVRAGLDRFADRSGAGELLAQAGLGDSLAALVGTAVRLTIVIVVSFAALTLLGLEFVSDSLNEGILFIPRLLAALALILFGIVLGAFVRAWIDRTSAQLDFPDRDRGRLLARALAEQDIDARHVRVIPDAETGRALITVDRRGENTIIVAAGANEMLTAADIDEGLRDIAAGDLLLLQLETPEPLVRHAARVASGAGATVVLNPTPVPDSAHDLFDDVDLLVVNEHELAHLADDITSLARHG